MSDCNEDTLYCQWVAECERLRHEEAVRTVRYDAVFAEVRDQSTAGPFRLACQALWRAYRAVRDTLAHTRGR